MICDERKRPFRDGGKDSLPVESEAEYRQEPERKEGSDRGDNGNDILHEDHPGRR